MSTEPRIRNLQDYLRVIRQQRAIIVIATLVFAGAALLVSVRQDPRYAAQSVLSFREPRADLGLVGGSSLFPTQSESERAAVGAQRVTRIEVARRVQRELRTPVSPENLRASVFARAEARTNLVVVEARANTAFFATSVANSFARQTAVTERVEYRKKIGALISAQERQLRSLRRRTGDQIARTLALERLGQLRSLRQASNPVEINSLATQPSSPVSPRPIRNTVLGLLLGLTIGLLAAFARDALDRRLRSREDIQTELGLPLLGTVEADAFKARNGTPPADGSDGLEAFRIIRTNIDFLSVDKPPRVILITSAVAGEGKSTVAASLARVLAGGGKRTLLVECDLRRPTIASRLGIAPTPGLTEYLLGRVSPREVVQLVAPDTSAPDPADDQVATAVRSAALACIAAGVEAPHPAELLASNRFQEFLTQVRDAYEFVIIDSAPLLAVGDTLELVPQADAVVVCVRSGVTTRDQAKGAGEALGHMPDRPTGVVVTGVSPRDSAAGYYAAYYGYARGD